MERETKAMKNLGIIAILAIGACIFYAFLSLMPDNSVKSKTAITSIPIIRSSEKSGVVTVILLDSTKSFQDFEAALRWILIIANSLGLNDTLYVISISAGVVDRIDIFVKPNGELLAKIRAIPEGATFTPELKAYIADYVEQIKQIQPNNITGTDLYGALLYASTVLQSDDQNREKKLLIYSDFGDTIENNEAKARINLTDVSVRCLYFPFDLANSKTAGWRADPIEIERMLKSFGAKDVKIKNPIQSDQSNPFK